jgi:hypothetical protein
MSDGSATLRGECFCRAAGLEVADAFEYAVNCHCSNCRRTTGSAFKPLAGIPAEHFALIRGADQVMRYGYASFYDAHCSLCGSLLYSSVRNGTYVHVPLGILIDTPSIRPSAHIFVGSKAPWHTICDDLPQYDEFAPG